MATEYVNYDEFETNKPQKSKSLYYRDGNPIEFDKRTEYYIAIRKSGDDVITLDDCGPNAFKFPYQWDPVTGERLKDADGNFIVDPYGPLCFDPDTLIHYYYINRLNGLWHEPLNPGEQGYYGDHLASGPNIDISGRGQYPERYLFRLPISDCYLPVDLPDIPTMGPILTNEEIDEIDRLAALNGPYEYQPNIRPTLKRMKRLYDIALKPEPNVNFGNPPTAELEKEWKYKINTQAVDNLKNHPNDIKKKLYK